MAASLPSAPHVLLRWHRKSKSNLHPTQIAVEALVRLQAYRIAPQATSKAIPNNVVIQGFMSECDSARRRCQAVAYYNLKSARQRCQADDSLDSSILVTCHKSTYSLDVNIPSIYRSFHLVRRLDPSIDATQEISVNWSFDYQTMFGCLVGNIEKIAVVMRVRILALQV
jgi:hypothetical protein